MAEHNRSRSRERLRDRPIGRTGSSGGAADHRRQLTEVDYALARVLAAEMGWCSMPNGRTLYWSSSGIVEVPTSAFNHWMLTEGDAWLNHSDDDEDGEEEPPSAPGTPFDTSASAAPTERVVTTDRSGAGFERPTSATS